MYYKAFLHFNLPLFSIFQYNNQYTDYYINKINLGVDHPTTITLVNDSTFKLNVKTHKGFNNSRGHRDDIQYKMKSSNPNSPDFLISEDNSLYYHKEWDRWIIEKIRVSSLVSVEEALPYFLKHNNLEEKFG